MLIATQTEEHMNKHWKFGKANEELNLLTFKTVDEIKDFVWNQYKTVNLYPEAIKEAIKSGDKAGQLVDIPTQRPYTLEGLCNYLGITFQTYLNYEGNKNYSEFFEVFAYVRKIIEEQQLSGAFSGAFNPMIAARKLGLQESQKIKQENINYNAELSKDEIKDIANELEEGY